MSETTQPAVTTAALHGPLWGARAADWARYTAPVSAPAWEAVAAATGIQTGTRVLDVGCGSGEFCRLAASRGASVSGIDASEALIGLARRLVPDADLRVGAIESLPWPDDAFDVVTGFNAFQFAGDAVRALAEAARVTRPAGQVAICAWGRAAECDVLLVVGALRELQPPAPGPPPPALGEPGVAERLAVQAGLEPRASGRVDVPFRQPDEEALVRALLAPGGVAPATRHAGEARVREALLAGAAPFRRPDGSYSLRNRFRYVLCTA
jgi:SAM-dependent methyltransferase